MGYSVCGLSTLKKIYININKNKLCEIKLIYVLHLNYRFFFFFFGESGIIETDIGIFLVILFFKVWPSIF